MKRDRAFLIFYARVLLRECAARRGSNDFYWMLFDGAQRARREVKALSRQPRQLRLFGEVAA